MAKALAVISSGACLGGALLIREKFQDVIASALITLHQLQIDMEDDASS